MRSTATRAGGSTRAASSLLSAKKLTRGHNPRHDTILGNVAFHNRPADLIWDGSGTGNHFVANHCGRSRPMGLCH